jgi:phosphatidylinositol-3-phosphatase
MENKKSMKKRIRNILIFTLTSCLIISTFCFKEFALRKANGKSFSNHVDDSVLIHPNHIIFLWLENKDFDTIIGNSSAPFINSLVEKGTLFTNTHAITHPSYPNYIAFFAGDPNGIKDDACIDTTTLSTANLYTTLKHVRKSFAWYSEDLPTTGSNVCIYDNYAAKHNPTTIFTNVSGRANKRFADFPTDYNRLENVVCISPNIVDDMHSGTIKQGDDWVKKHLAPLVDWCKTHNSIFIIYFDESGVNQDNRIPVIAIGNQVKAGFKLDTRYDHYSWTKTVSAMFLAQDAWTDNLSTAKLITGCWK